MFTPELKTLLAVGACTVLVAAGCATQRAGDVPQIAYGGAKLNLGAVPTPAEMARYFSYPADGRSLPSGAGTYAQGEKVYQTKCMACHGDKLQGGPIAPALTGPKWRHIDGSYGAILDRIDQGMTGTVMMRRPGRITEAQVLMVATYVWAVSHGRAQP